MWGLTQSYQELMLDYWDDKREVQLMKVVLDGEHFVVSSLAFTGGQTLEQLTKQLPWAIWSVNWSFFCPDDYSYCNGQTTTISERVYMWDAKSYSRYRPDTWVRWVFGFTKDWSPLLAQNNFWYISWLAENFNNDRVNEFYYWLWNWPVLLMDWKDVVAQSDMHMDAKLRSTRTQMFICHTKDENTVYMWTITNTNIFEMPELLREKLNCYNAINLDAWASTAMIYDHKVLKRSPRTRIMDAFVVVDRNGYEVMNYTAPARKTPYLPDDYYVITPQDIELVDLIYSKIRKSINWFRNVKLRPEVKKYVIKTLYKWLATPKAKSDPRVKKIIKEILLKFVVIEKI